MKNKDYKLISKKMKIANKRYTKEFVEVPADSWPEIDPDSKLMKVLRSRNFLVQIFNDTLIRLSIQKTSIKEDGSWQDKITWDELQEIKNKCGFEDHCAIELFPPEKDKVTDYNIRHLWILKRNPNFMWSRENSTHHQG